MTEAIQIYQEECRGLHRLYCFHYAGGSTVVYSDFHKSLPPWIDVVPVQLPGHGPRFKEGLRYDLHELVAGLADDLAPNLGQTSFSFLGYSMGALVAYELSRTLVQQGKPTPERLFVAAQKSPCSVDDPPYWHTLSDDDLIDKLAGLGGTPSHVLASPILLDMFLPIIRADFSIVETYRPGPGDEALPIPVIAFYGDQDTIAWQQRVEKWAHHTSADFTLEKITGGHFFIKDNITEFGRKLSKYFEQPHYHCANSGV